MRRRGIFLLILRHMSKNKKSTAACMAAVDSNNHFMISISIRQLSYQYFSVMESANVCTSPLHKKDVSLSPANRSICNVS